MKIYGEISSLEEAGFLTEEAAAASEVICRAGLGEEFIRKLGEIYQDGISASELDCLLAYNSEYCFGLVDLVDMGEDPVEIDEDSDEEIDVEFDDDPEEIDEDADEENDEGLGESPEDEVRDDL